MIILPIGSCNPIELTPGIDKFNVTIDVDSVKVGEEITFHFKGNPNLISFYSGELNHQYEYKDSTIVNGVSMGPDHSIAVKGFETGYLSSFNYIYNTSGSYKVNFVAQNITINDEVQVVRSLVVTVTQ